MKKNKTGVLFFLGLVFFFVFYFRCYILHPGVSKVKIVTPSGAVSALTIPNEMVAFSMLPPVHEELPGIYLNLEPELRSGRGPKYTLWLKANDNNNSIWTVTLPNRIARMRKVESKYDGYEKYTRTRLKNITSFWLVGQDEGADPIFIICRQGYPNILANCTYIGIYDDKLRYDFMFPGEELKGLSTLIVYAENKIALLLDNE